MDVSPLLKILLVFAGMLALTRFRVHLGLALVMGGVALGLWADRGILQTAIDLGSALTHVELWLLIAITALILEFGRHMSEQRNAQVIMSAARAWGGHHGHAASLMAIPAAIGLVPMPGGALFSAPLVGQVAGSAPVSPSWKSAVNYWFRHTWEYWWPLYPVVIVTLSIFPMEIGHFILMQLPLSAATLVGGYVLLIRPHLKELAEMPHDETSETGRFRVIALPLAIVVVCTMVLPILFQAIVPAWSVQTRKMLAMLTGLMLGLVPLLRDSGEGAAMRFLKTLMEGKVLGLLATIAGVIVFKNLLEASGLLPLAGDRLIASGIPLLWVVALLPFVAGLVTGIAIGYAGIAFPLIAGLTGVDTGLATASTLMIGFAFGYAGMMCSPVHLCFVLTRGYFGVSVTAMLRHVVPLTLFPLGTALLWYVLLLRAGW